jgi:DNA-binding MarR family transcriptional regulator
LAVEIFADEIYDGQTIERGATTKDGKVMVEEPRNEWIVHLLSKVCEEKHRRMHEGLDRLGLYRGQPSMLRALWGKDGMTHSELAEQLDRCPETITKMVQRMERAGFVERRSDPNDERLSRVYLTPAGRTVKSAVEDVWAALEEQVVTGFTETEVTLLQGLLTRVSRNIAAEPCAERA